MMVACIGNTENAKTQAKKYARHFQLIEAKFSMIQMLVVVLHYRLDT